MSNTFKDKEWRKFKRGKAAFPKHLRYKRNGKGSPIATCHCAQCKLGRKSGWGEAQMKRFVAGHKATVKALLRKGEFDNIPETIYVGCTD